MYMYYELLLMNQLLIVATITQGYIYMYMM